MAKKLSDLVAFVDRLRKRYHKKYINLSDLKLEISKTFGYSDYVIKGTLNAMIDFNLIVDIGSYQFEFVISKTKEQLEDEAEAEANKLLEKVAESDKKKKQHKHTRGT